jgi:hypothetical protein
MYDDLTPRKLPLTDETIGAGDIKRVSLMQSVEFETVSV